MGIRSWVRKKLEDFGEWFYETIVEPAVDWLQRAIDNIIVALRIFRHNLKAKLAEWLDNDIFFLVFLVNVISLAIYLPQIIAAASSWIVTIWIQSMIIKLKDRLVKLIDVNKYIDLLMLHNILLVLWEEYKKAFYSFAEVISQFAAELGEGSAYLHTYFSALRGIMHGTNAVLGGDPLQTEIEWYGRCADFFERANDRFARYARDPGRLLYDFLNEVLIPAAEEQREVNQAELDEIRENRDRVVEVDEGMTELRESLDTFIELQPNVIEAEVRERWDPINEAWEEIQTTFYGEFVRILNGIVDAVELRAEQQTRINAVAQAKADEQNRAIYEAWLLTEDQASQAGASAEYTLGLSMREDQEGFDEAIKGYVDRYGNITADFIRDLSDRPALVFEQPGVISVKPDRLVDIPSPFVGDY